MLIAALDADRQYTKKLGKTLKRLLHDVEFKAFTSGADCLKYTETHDIALIFINQNFGMQFSELQTLHHKLRKLRAHIDIIIVYEEQARSSNVAIWSIQSRCSDYICKSDTVERLTDALQNTWFQPIMQSNYPVYPALRTSVR